MLIFLLFTTHLWHPRWLTFSWIRSSSFMACQTLLFLIETQLSQATFGKNCSSYKVPNCISAQLIIPRQMVKRKSSTSVWKHISGALPLKNNTSGLNGYPSQNGDTTLHTIQPLAWLLLKQYMDRSHLQFSHTYQVPRRSRWITKCLQFERIFSIPSKRIWSWNRIAWSNKQIKVTLNVNLQKGIRCFFDYNLTRKTPSRPSIVRS